MTHEIGKPHPSESAWPTSRLIGRALVPGAASGPVLATDVPLSLWGGLDPATGEVIDRRHPLSGQVVTGCVLALPATRGSSTTSTILLEAIRAGTAPTALVIAAADPVLALGAVVAAEVYGRSIPIVVLDPSAFRLLRTGALAVISADGTVEQW
ncbi:MAG: DUF126 domain-containing protein [Chloroflexi bacterium]|nr:DUF126 domain-containing protein [Chloroflexota bacterium]